jgi:hypothetical protein
VVRRFLVSLTIVCSLCAQSRVPQFEAETLSGKRLTMPEAAPRYRDALLVVGFTPAAEAQCAAWMKRFRTQFAAAPAVREYAVIFREGDKGPARPATGSEFGSSATKYEYDRWLIVTEHEKEMKAAVHFQTPDDAYLVLLYADGEIRWTGHGTVSDDLMNQILNILKGWPAR